VGSASSLPVRSLRVIAVPIDTRMSSGGWLLGLGIFVFFSGWCVVLCRRVCVLGVY
jgi:hypothetical protein